jgi:hypothetical protein
MLDYLYGEMVRNPGYARQTTLARVLRARGNTFWNRWSGWAVRTGTLKAGDVLLEEQAGGRPFRIEVLHPDAAACQERPLENRSTVLRIVYGHFAMLVTGNLHYEGQRRLVSACAPEQLSAGVLVMPNHGASVPGGPLDEFKNNVEDALRQAVGPLLEKVNPDTVIFEFGNPRSVLGRQARDAENVFGLTWRFVEDRLGADRCLSTDRDLAVLIDSDGWTYKIRTQAEMGRTAADQESAVEDVEVGF